MIVVDTNVVAGLWLPTDWSGSCERLLEAEPEWAAPVLWRSEFRNVLATYVRAGRIEFDLALSIVQSAEVLFQGREFSIGSIPVLRLASSSGCSVYDCEFVSLAQRFGIQLVTLDSKLHKAFPRVAISPDRFLGAA